MRWTKLKKRVEDNFARSIRSRVALHSTRYGGCNCGHAWVTLDGCVIANFCTRAHYNRFVYGRKEQDVGLTAAQVGRYRQQSVEYGELSRQDAYAACWEYVHHLSFNDALVSDDPLIQSLAVLDRRLGKRRYKEVEAMHLHPLARKLLRARLSAEIVSA